MFAHRYAGTSPTSSVTPPGIRRHLVHSGYACAASSCSANYYHVSAGVGVADTNALALGFNAVAAQNGRPLAAPVRTYITGRSIGGHIAAAAVEAETLATAVNKYHYHAALPMCGVMADVEVFNRFVGLQAAAQALAGVPDQPFGSWTNVQAQVSSSLFTSFSTAALPTTPIITTAKGAQLGDLYVPFAMQQICARRAATNGSSALLVQCAQCGAAHANFTVAGQVESFEALAS